MSKLLIKEKQIVTPGETLAEGMDYLPGPLTYRKNNKIYSKVLGLVNISGRAIRITPLSGPYIPKAKDKIIAQTIDIAMSGWRFDINTAYSAMLNVKDATTRFIRKDEDLSKILSIGDFIVARITKVTSQNLIDLTMKEPGLSKLERGRIIRINSQKVPRIIGREGSMINLIKNKTKCEITVGQNGLVWVKGIPEMEKLTEEAIGFIGENSHKQGLTNQVEKFLDKKLGK